VRNINRNFPRERLARSSSMTSLEVTESEIINTDRSRQAEYIYPRHVCFNGINLDRYRHANPQTICSIVPNNDTSYINSKETFYQASDEIVRVIHLENLRQNLEKRLQTAKIKGDDRLINLLEKEFQQLAR
jgi:hypothetical protein